MNYEDLPSSVKKLISKIEKKYHRSTTMTDKDMVILSLYLFKRYYKEEEE